MSEMKYGEAPLLLVDDELAWLRGMSLALTRALGHDRIRVCQDSREVPELLAREPVSLVVLDVTMPHLSGEELLAILVERYPEVPVIMLTGRSEVEIAVRCMKQGAFDYFVKTGEEEKLMAGVRRALAFARLQQENRALRASILHEELQHPEAFAPLLTASGRMRDLFRYIEAIAASPEPVLISGASGTGKELVARAVQRVSRPGAPWVAVNAAGLDDQVFADTLFGHRRGAYTGANENRAGMIEQAGDGVLFLDEIGDLSSASQVKLLRLLQEGEYYPLGSDRPARLKARLVFATNCDLEALQAAGRFRRDLYYRLCAHRIDLPPLRERPEDLALLLDHFLTVAAEQLGRRKPTPPPELPGLLRTHPFPGNVRELRALVFDAVSRHRGGVLSMEVFRQALGSAAGATVAAGAEAEAEAEDVAGLYVRLAALPTIRQAVDALVREALRRADGRLSLAARLLGISRPALSKRLNK